MPGHDANRFVDLSPNEKDELTCGICQDIMRCPVVTSCCLQTFCDHCINDWLKTRSICPYDRKPLTNYQLSRAPRALTNLLGKLRIRCDFRSNGCNEVIDLENLGKHSQQCAYNPFKVCEKCFCDKSAHNCIEYLLDTNNRITIELNQIKINYNELRRDNNNATHINSINQSNQPSISSPTISTTNKYNQSINEPQILDVDMSDEMRDDAINTALRALLKYSAANERKKMATFITKEFDIIYGYDWNCIIGDNFNSYVKYTPKHYIYFRFGLESILLYKLVK